MRGSKTRQPPSSRTARPPACQFVPRRRSADRRRVFASAGSRGRMAIGRKLERCRLRPRLHGPSAHGLDATSHRLDFGQFRHVLTIRADVDVGRRETGQAIRDQSSAWPSGVWYPTIEHQPTASGLSISSPDGFVPARCGVFSIRSTTTPSPLRHSCPCFFLTTQTPFSRRTIGTLVMGLIAWLGPMAAPRRTCRSVTSARPTRHQNVAWEARAS